MQVVNSAIADRLRTASKTDSALNALVSLDYFAQTVPAGISESLEEIRYLFTPFLRQRSSAARDSDRIMIDKLKILVIEDDERVVALYDRGLAGNVFEKCFVRNGSDALAIYKSWAPDIVLLDIMLPGMSGYSILKEIREHNKDWTTTIIMATSINKKEEVVNCAKLGIQGYIVKPFSYKVIGAKILQYYQNTDPVRARTATSLLNSLRA
ncbi:MAG: response regulator [Pseudomonadota bacterium]